MSLERLRQRMLADIESEVAYTRRMIGRDHLDPRVMDAMRQVPREEFVPPNLRQAAFDNGPLPVGYGQTISQPYIVALMTDLLELQAEHRVLEIGTGCGYQSAILSTLCQRVYSMEVVPQLSEATQLRLQEMGYDNVELKVGNGYLGWPDHAPYDGIIVTAAADQVPQALVDQLKPGGRLVIPVGQPYSYQELLLVKKDDDGEIHKQHIIGVAFVPMVHKPA